MLYLIIITIIFFLLGAFPMLLLARKNQNVLSAIPIAFVISYSLIALSLSWISTLGVPFDVITSTLSIAIILLILIALCAKKWNLIIKQIPKQWDVYTSITLLLVLISTLFGYLLIIAPGYVVPPGDDSATHAYTILKIIETKNVLSAAKIIPNYPLGMHLTVAWISLIAGIPITEVMKVISFIAIPISVLALFSLMSEIFNTKIGMLSSLISLFSTTVLWVINDGTLPLVIAFCIVLVMAFYFLFRFLYEGRLSDAFTSALIFSAGALTHPYSLFFIPVIILFLILKTFLQHTHLVRFSSPQLSNSQILLRITCVMFIVLVTSFYPTWSKYLNITSITTNLTQQPTNTNLTQQPTTIINQTANQSAVLNIFTSPQDLPYSYIFYLGPPVIFLGFIGIVLLPFYLQKTTRMHSFIFIFSWLASSAILSLFRFGGLSFSLGKLPGFYPLQFARFISIPLSMFGGIALDFLVYDPLYGILASKSRNKILSVLLMLSIVLASFYVAWSTPQIYGHELTSSMIRMDNLDYGAVVWLSKNSPTSSVVLVGPLDGWLRFFLPDNTILISSDNGFPDVINNPNNLTAMKEILYYNISYIFVRPKPNGWIPEWIPDKTWNYCNEYELSKSSYLTRIFTTESNDGNISIYEVDQAKLTRLIHQQLVD